METLSQLATIFAVVAPTYAVALGHAPRIGPARAIWLGLKSRFKALEFKSQREDTVKELRETMQTMAADKYIIVAGPKGVGKTCVVKTATNAMWGVIHVRISAGQNEKDINADVFTAIARSFSRSVDNSGSASRVLFWHSIFFRTPVTVVLEAAEISAGGKFAALDSAARGLTQTYGKKLRLIIDAEDNSLPESATATKRQMLILLDTLPRSMLETLPELNLLLEFLDREHLADVVFLCLGGNPADYGRLRDELIKSDSNKIERVTMFLQNILNKAIDKKNKHVTENEPFQELYELFREHKEISSSMLKTMKLKRPSPDKVLREVQMPTSLGESETMLIPADAAMALVLRFDLKKAPSLKVLKELVLANN